MGTIGSEEAEIVEAAAFAGAIGFEEFARSARPALVRVAHAVTGRVEDAEDAVQASLLKAMRAWPRVAGQERWRQQAYVRQIVVNTCRSGWRKWGSRVLVGDMPELVQAAKTGMVDDRELVREALSRLPARQRDVLLLRYYEDLSETEIAKSLGCAPGTVKSSAARALRALRDMLPEYAGTSTGPVLTLNKGDDDHPEPVLAVAGRPPELGDQSGPLRATEAGPFLVAEPGPLLATRAGPFLVAEPGPFGATQAGPFLVAEAGPFGAAEPGPFGATEPGPLGAAKAGPFLGAAAGSLKSA